MQRRAGCVCGARVRLSAYDATPRSMPTHCVPTSSDSQLTVHLRRSIVVGWLVCAHFRVGSEVKAVSHDDCLAVGTLKLQLEVYLSPAVMALVVFHELTTFDLAPPPLVVHVPTHCLLDGLSEGVAWLPA